MISTEFEYARPKTLREAVRLLGRHGKSARILAGGTDLIGWLRDDLVKPDILIDIKGIGSLGKLSFRQNMLRIGAGVTITELTESRAVRTHFPLFVEMAGMGACTGIRNRATVVGNICSAVPCCDNGPVLMVYEAVLQVTGQEGDREIPMSEWFKGPRQTALRPGEIVTGVTVPKPAGRHAACFAKLKRYRGEDLAQASVAVLRSDSICRVAFGSVAPTPVRAPNIERILTSRMPPEAALEAAIDAIPKETSPITDLRSSKEYRGRMLGVMLERAVKTVASRLEGSGPAYGVNVLDDYTADAEGK